MSYGMYLITAAGAEVPFPVLPETLKVSSPGKDETVDVLGLGEVLLLRPKGLRTLAWDGLFPVRAIPAVTGKLTAPMELVRTIQAARESRQALRLLLLGTDLDVNMAVGVTSFDYEERGGEPGDLYYSIELTEWKPHGARRLVLSPDGESAVDTPPGRTGAPETPKRYTVAAGDCLWTIAKRFYGDGSQWGRLYEANRGVLGPDPGLIYPGQVIEIP